MSFLDPIDWILIAVYLCIVLFIAFRFKNAAEKSITDFFLGGRNIPWFIAGISMVATTFGADTPLAVTELVNNNGISGNWLWWNMLIGGMLTTFFFAKLWRRANILTELEFIELRYSGKPAAFLRGFKTLYLGILLNTLIIAWVNLAFISIIKVFFPVAQSYILLILAATMLFAAFSSTLAGLKGVAVTDAVQFIIAITGSVILAVIILNTDEIEGISGLKSKLPDSAFNFFPKIQLNDMASTGKALGIGFASFFAYIGIQWWASWYPGAEPGGGGYVAQRMMSTRTEKDAVWATLFFQIAHYTIRPWPWILVGLSTIVLYPGLGAGEEKLGYIMAIRDYMPSGLKGLMLVALLAAYMSTISTQLNWGASYVLNDFYKRFIKPPEQFKATQNPEQHYVIISRVVTVVIMGIGLYVTTLFQAISEVWYFLIECGAGLGLVLILRWYWWRINAWSEITATIVPFVVYAVSRFALEWKFPESFFFTVSVTTLAWIIVTFTTRPTSTKTLTNFYQKVKPGGRWKPFCKQENLPLPTANLAPVFICWVSSVVMIYSILFGTGKLIFQHYGVAGIWFGIALLSFGLLKRKIKYVF